VTPGATASATAVATVLAPAPPQAPPTTTSQPRSTGDRIAADALGPDLHGPGPVGGRELPGGHDDDARPSRQRPDGAGGEDVGSEQHQRRLPVRAAQRRPSRGELRLCAGGGQKPQEVVEEPLVGADDEGAGRCA
jgi:hypothetical protein